MVPFAWHPYGRLDEYPYVWGGSGQGDGAGTIGGRSAYASRGESVATATAAPYRAAAGSGS